MHLVQWIRAETDPRPCGTAELHYDHVASQSGECLPIIYRPFDPGRHAHWRDRGSRLDFLVAAGARGGRVLDFGPGDGWPSLIIADEVAGVVGVEGSARRADTCAANAARLGIANARFLHVPGGRPLPFADGSFDAVVAASPVEQSPSPRAALAELVRVLRPGGRLRLDYEALGRYRGRDPDIYLVETVACFTVHPSGSTMDRWLRDLGCAVRGTHSGAGIAGAIFRRLPARRRPRSLAGVDERIRDAVAVGVELAAPLADDPMLTAVKEG